MSQKVTLQEDEIAVSQNDFSILICTFVRDSLQYHNDERWMDTHLREWWPKVESYYRRQIICDIEIEIRRSEPSRANRKNLFNREMWVKLVKDLRDPRTPFTVKYACTKCNQEGVKLWRGMQNADDLECASCLAPDIQVNEKGLSPSRDHIQPSDCLKNKVPAVPMHDTFWGYSSVPSQDVEWWTDLPTYPERKV